MKWRSPANLCRILGRLDAKTHKTIWQKAMRGYVFKKMIERGVVTAKGKFRARQLGNRWEYQSASSDARARRGQHLKAAKIEELKRRFGA